MRAEKRTLNYAALGEVYYIKVLDIFYVNDNF